VIQLRARSDVLESARLAGMTVKQAEWLRTWVEKAHGRIQGAGGAPRVTGAGDEGTGLRGGKRAQASGGRLAES
jgi:hypothetical protein